MKTLNLANSIEDLTLYKKKSFPLRISSVNVTKSAVSCSVMAAKYKREVKEDEVRNTSY